MMDSLNSLGWNDSGIWSSFLLTTTRKGENYGELPRNERLVPVSPSGTSNTYGQRYVKISGMSIRSSAESSITEVVQRLEQPIPEFLIELSPALFGGIQLR